MTDTRTDSIIESKTETIYFDNAATTFPKPECVYTKMDLVNRTLAVNAGRGSYALAKKATALIDEVRDELLNMVNGMQVAEVVLTTSATVALNQIIGGMNLSEDVYIYVSPYEHNAVMRTLKNRIGNENRIVIFPVTDTMEIDLEKLQYMFAVKPPECVFSVHVSNVTGYILPIDEITLMAKQYQAKVIIDASQSLGLVDINLTKIEADYVVFAGHKTLYGPFGVGGFFMRNGNYLDTFLAGGTGTDSLNLDMPQKGLQRYEPASPNITAIAGLLEALKWHHTHEKDELLKREKELTAYMTDKLEKISGIKLYLPPTDVHAGIVAFNIENLTATDVGRELDEMYDIAVRTGYHCAPYVHDVIGDKGYLGVVRASVGAFTTLDEIDRLVEAVKEIAEG